MEVVVLRHQLAVLKRQVPGRAFAAATGCSLRRGAGCSLDSAGRRSWSARRRCFGRRELVRRKWTYRRPPSGGRRTQRTSGTSSAVWDERTLGGDASGRAGQARHQDLGERDPNTRGGAAAPGLDLRVPGTPPGLSARLPDLRRIRRRDVLGGLCTSTNWPHDAYQRFPCPSGDPSEVEQMSA
jgi:hypothetical protein